MSRVCGQEDLHSKVVFVLVVLVVVNRSHSSTIGSHLHRYVVVCCFAASFDDVGCSRCVWRFTFGSVSLRWEINFRPLTLLLCKVRISVRKGEMKECARFFGGNATKLNRSRTESDPS